MNNMKKVGDSLITYDTQDNKLIEDFKKKNDSALNFDYINEEIKEDLLKSNIPSQEEKDRFLAIVR